MTRKKQTRGTCLYCGREMTRGGLSKHLYTCLQRLEAIGAANEQSGTNEQQYHLVVRDAWAGDFWLHIEMSSSSTLEDLDSYLRTIWLECCGHLSRFSIGRWNDEIPMHTPLRRLPKSITELYHIYDFGTSSETVVEWVDQRHGKSTTSHPVTLMARNTMPEIQCMKCTDQATWLCLECISEHDTSGTLCDAHASSHPHEEYGDPLPLVNSPRSGMCGYEGPAEPPY